MKDLTATDSAKRYLKQREMNIHPLNRRSLVFCNPFKTDRISMFFESEQGVDELNLKGTESPYNNNVSILIEICMKNESKES